MNRSTQHTARTMSARSSPKVSIWRGITTSMRTWSTPSQPITTRGWPAGGNCITIHSGEILLADTALHHWFTEEQLAVMRDAVEDHRASSGHAPRTIYGRIVAEADRCIDPATVLRRTVQYGLAHYPALDREGHFERCLAHLRKKYAEGGYLRLWIPESDNARKQEELRALIRDEARLRAAFDTIFDRETAR